MKVLLVDDELFTIRMLQNLIHWSDMGLELVGYAQSGEEAYEKVMKDPPDIILSDIKMPGMSGIEFLKKINSYDSSIKTILMSAYADFSYVKEGMKLGCSDYILKPIDEVELEQAFRKVIFKIHGEKEQERVVSKSAEQLEKIKLYQYMRTGSGINKLKQTEQWQKLNIQNYVVFMVFIDSTSSDEYDQSTNLVMGQEGYISHILEKILSSCSLQYQLLDFEENCWIIMIENNDVMRREEIAERIVAEMQDNMGISVNICFSLVGHEIEKLPELYEEVKNLSKYSFYIGEKKILGYGYNCDKKELDEVSKIGNEKDLELITPESGSTTKQEQRKYSKAVAESIALIEKRYKENISLEEVCDEIAVSKNYFCYLFKRETGMSVWNYLTMIRLQKAKELLESTQLKSYEIAFQVGYDNPSYFSKIFKKYEDLTPNEYRNIKLAISK